MCSRKWATPLFFSVSFLEPVSIQTPTVAVGAPLSSDATRRPLSKTVSLVGGTLTRVCSYFVAADVDLNFVAVYKFIGTGRIIYCGIVCWSVNV